jgi:hypothetical protein
MEPLSNIAEPVKRALQAIINGYADGLLLDGKQVNDWHREQLMLELVPIFSQVGDFRKKLSDLDKVMQRFADFLPVTEYIFDFLMLNFIASDSAKMEQNYLESEEWVKIEDETADRGTELLNLLIYISEAKETEVEISLQDFLDEFLLADEELFQDEYFIYESVIKNVNLTEAGIDELIETAKKIEQEEIKELFLPMMVYFNTATKDDEKMKALKNSDYNRALSLAIYSSILAYESGSL